MARTTVARKAEVDASSAQVDPSEHRAEFDQRQFGAALIEIYDAGAAQPVKTELLDQFVSIIRRKDRPDERARDIAKLLRDWQERRCS